MLKRLGRAGAVLMAVLLAGAAFAAPARSAPPRLSVGPGLILFDKSSGRIDPQGVTVFIDGGSASTVSLEFADALPDPIGGWRDIPFGTSPDSLEGVVTIGQPEFEYIPNDGQQEFTAYLTLDAEALTRPRYGSLIVTMRPLDPGEGDITTNVSIATQVLATPTTADIEALGLDLALELGGLSVRQIEPWTPVDRVFPNFPFLVNHGPVFVTVQGKNVGDLVLEERTTFSFTKLNILEFLGISDAEGKPSFTVTDRPRFVLPEEPFRNGVSSVIPVNGEPAFDSLPFIGFVRITAKAEGSVAGVAATPGITSRTFVVFPWSEFLFLFTVWVVQREWRHRKGRSVNRSDTPPPPTFRTKFRERLGKLLRRRGGAGSVSVDGIPQTPDNPPGAGPEREG